MATVTLDDLWIHLESDRSQYIKVPVSALTEQHTVPVEARQYANGVVKSIRRTGSRASFTARLELVSRADVDLIRSWTGEKVMVRDPRHRKFWGFYASPTIDEAPGAPDLANVTIVFQETSHSEDV